jgi:hypothetical protein
MPPLLTDWVPDDHLVWTVLGAVQQMDLDVFFGAYRANGQGRAAYDPAMMARCCCTRTRWGTGPRGGSSVLVGSMWPTRSSRHCGCRITRRSRSCAAGTRRRWEVFVEVLALCAEASLVSVGVVAIDATKIKANASRDHNRSYESIVAEILDEAEKTDQDEGDRHGPDRGDELPERFRSRESRRAALAETGSVSRNSGHLRRELSCRPSRLRSTRSGWWLRDMDARAGCARVAGSLSTPRQAHLVLGASHPRHPRGQVHLMLKKVQMPLRLLLGIARLQPRPVALPGSGRRALRKSTRRSSRFAAASNSTLVTCHGALDPNAAWKRTRPCARIRRGP